jgi:hypothetical protein
MTTTKDLPGSKSIPADKVQEMIEAAVARALEAHDAIAASRAAAPVAPAPAPILTVPEGDEGATVYARLRAQDRSRGCLHATMIIPAITGSHQWRGGEWAETTLATARRLGEVRNEYSLVKGRDPEPAFEFASAEAYQAIRAHELAEGEQAEARLAAMSTEAMRREEARAQRAVATARSHRTMAILK